WSPGAPSPAPGFDPPVQVRDFGGPPGAPVLLCLHGLGGSALNWGAVAPRLTGTHRVLAPDLAGHGGSPAAGGAGALEALTRQVAAHLRAARREAAGAPVTLVGHSLGGVVALLAAAGSAAAPAAPAVDRLVLLCPPVPRPVRGRVDAALLARLALLRAPGTAAAVRRLSGRRTPCELVLEQVRGATPHPERVPGAALRAAAQEVAAQAARPGAAAAAAFRWTAVLGTTGLLARTGAWRRLLASVRVPVLWVQGAQDPRVRADRAAAWAARVPGARFELLPGVGHLPHLEAPARTAGLLREGSR
ncbi:alpha/beta fold hydrolase, partial [Kineococcus indalonis]|uniref:alpha/beta fold hydrolase n=1 Tax=Kineococcus indalonis TaxID=2696566 RepID=UPI001412996F